ncbi:hypothetical protein TL16_g04539 [Triparma laevis f. inornata]|uniref:Cytochrome P450 n=1 Tax=Triparma laevis f. inornata TaxID=1714386 RepID=A0A9W7ACH7_9STRA|nr:hypothetical protein TL16_g04539 [Triparma laevis f. inornata]
MSSLNEVLAMAGLSEADIPRIVAALVLLVSLAIWKSIKPYHPPKNVPGPPCKPFVGVLHLIDKNWSTLPDFILSYDQKFGRSWAAPVPNIGLLGSCLFSLVTEENIKHVLKDEFANYEKGKNVREALGEFLGDGIFTADGPSWKHHRKVASQMFSRNLMRNGTTVALRQVKLLVEKLDKLTQPSSTSSTVDMQDMFFRMTIDVFASIAFGVELDSILSDKPHPFAVAFDEVQNLSQKRFRDPIWRWKRNLQVRSCEDEAQRGAKRRATNMIFKRLTDAERRIRKGCKTMKDFAMEVIHSKRREASNNESMGPDLLSRFLDTKNPFDGEAPGDNELRDIVMNFMIAGRDTTACALSWTLYELAKNPEVCVKVVEEIQQVCNGGDAAASRSRTFSDAEYSYENIGNLTYTHAVAMEVLRLHPSVPVDIKFAVKADKLPDGTFIPAGSSVLYSPYAMGRNEKIWGVDAKKFKPERFVDDGKISEPSQYKFTTFNAGYRLCLGKPLAMLEIKLALAMLLPRFKFSIANGHKGGYQSTLVLPMAPELMMTVTKR